MPRRPTAACLAALLLLAATSAGAAVNADYDQGADFAKLKTFAFKPGTPAQSQLAENRIRQIVMEQLKAEGMTPVDSEPDAFIVTHVAKDQRTNISVNDYGYRYGRSYMRWGGHGSVDVNVHEYEVGTLLVDIVDAASGDLVWRGSATATVVENPAKMYRRVEKAVEKLFKKHYPPGK